MRNNLSTPLEVTFLYFIRFSIQNSKITSKHVHYKKNFNFRHPELDSGSNIILFIFSIDEKTNQKNLGLRN